MLQNFCEIAVDYPALLRTLKDPLNLRASARIIQFPFTLPVTEEKTEEELARIAERKKEQGRKLQEIAAKSRMEKVSYTLPFLGEGKASLMVCSYLSCCRRRMIYNTCSA